MLFPSGHRLFTTAIAQFLVVLSMSLLVSACGSSGGLLDKSLEMVGLKKPDVPDEVKTLPPPSLNKKIALRVHAGDQLNTDAQGRSLSVIVRIYKLRGASAFLMAPYKAFGQADAEKAAFGSDLVEVRELVLTPGQRHEVVETLPSDAAYLAVATLFRAPSEGRWRFAFKAKDAEKSGVTLGVHGCALSVASGTPEGAAPETLRLAGVRCQ